MMSKRNFALLSLSLALLLTRTPTLAADSAESLFQAGVAAFQKADLATAREQLQKSLQAQPGSAPALYNLGLVEYEAKSTGLALALWRKALAVDPGYRPASLALHWATGKLEHPEIAHQTEVWETLRSNFLTATSLSIFLAFTAVLLLFSGWLILRYFGKRRRAVLDESPMPPTPWIAIALAFFFLLFASSSIAKLFDLDTKRATVLPPKVDVRSTPEISGVSLFELFEGLEVIVQQSSGDWVQVTYPGALTGWVPKSAIMITSGP
jgi:tetratricopeptide (TPR) repeat protein